METANAGDTSVMRLDYTSDVISMMAEIRRGQWCMTYPEGER